MRSLYNALALCAVTLMMSGCVSNVAGTYDSSCNSGCCGSACNLSDHPGRLGMLHSRIKGGTCQAGCGSCATAETTCDACNAVPTTNWAAPVTDCGCGDSGCGGGCQAAPAEGGCNSCGQKCGGRCGMKSRPMAMPRSLPAPQMARGRIFGSNQNMGCGGTGCGGCPDCGSAPAGMSGIYTGGFQACSHCGKPDCRGCRKTKSAFGMGMPANGGGCGKFGCGQRGQLCLRCRVQNGMGSRVSQAGGDCGCDSNACQGCDSGTCGNGGCGWAGLGLGGLVGNGAEKPHPLVDRLRAKGCGTPGCGTGGQLCTSCVGGGGNGGLQGGCGSPGCGMGGRLCSRCLGGNGSGMASGCGTPGCGVGGRLCSSCLGGNGSGMPGGCGAPGCGVGGQLCAGCLSRLYGGHLHKKAAHMLPAMHPYGGAIPHTEPQPGMGGQAPTYAYPYYTTRGPRDFLQDNPPTIGY